MKTLGLLVALALLGGCQPLTDGCLRVELEPSALIHASSAAWSATGDELVLVDVAGARLLRYAKTGEYLGSVSRPGEGAFDFDKPTEIHPAEGGFVLRNSFEKWIWLDRNLNPLRSVVAMEGRHPIFNFLSEVLTADELTGFGSFQKAPGHWTTGFFRASLTPPAFRETLEETDLATKDGTLYLELVPVVAQAAGHGYALRFGEPSVLMELPTKARLRAFPTGLDRLPTLPEHLGQPSAVARRKVLERSALPVHLYGSGDYLYLLTRRPESKGKTLWELHQLDPLKDRLVRSMILPSSANNLLIAPGPKSWALFEKGESMSTGEQPLTSLVLLPSSWVEAHQGSRSLAICNGP